MKPKLVVVVGPTAVGKTKTGIEIAKHFNGEVISGDSMQVYRGMDIGTAKVTEEEKEGIPHHLIDIKDANEPYSAAEFKQQCEWVISELKIRNKLPILVGGTGLYIRSVTYGYEFTEASNDPSYRRELGEFASKYGNSALHDKLKDIDPLSYKKIHPNNVKRVIRALEVYEKTGEAISTREKQPESPYHLIMIGLTMGRERLYERINLRVDLMVKEGLFAEVKHLLDSGVLPNSQSMRGIGYKEIVAYFKGECSKEEAINQLKRNSRRFAKRQFTWFNNQMDIEWFDLTEQSIDEKIPQILNFVAGKLSNKSK